MTHLRRLLALLSLAFFVVGQADEPPRLVVQTTHPRTNGRIALSPDRSLLVTADDDGTLKVWAVDSGLLLRTAELEIGIRQIGFDRSGRLVVAGPDKVLFYDPVHGQEVGALKTDRPLCTTFDFAGSSLITGDTAQSVIQWDSSGRKEKTLATLKDVVRAVRVSPDAKNLAVLSQDGLLTFFSLPSGKKSGSLPGFEMNSGIDFSSDGKLVAARTADSVKVLQVSSRKIVQSLPPAQSRDATTFGMGASLYYRTDNGIGQFDASSGGLQRSNILGLVATLDFRVLSDRRTAAITRIDDSVQLYDLDAGAVIQTFQGATGAVNALAASGIYCLTGSDDGWIHLWNTLTGRPVASFRAHPGGVSGVAFMSNGTRAVSVGADGSLRTFQLPGLQPEKTLQISDFPLLAVAATPNGSKVAAIDFQGHVHAGEIDAPLSEVGSLDGRGRCLAFSQDGQFLAAGSGSGDVMVYQESGVAPMVYASAHKGTITFLGFSHDGHRLVSASIDGTAKIWTDGNRATAKTITFDSSVFSGAMSPDGNRVALGGWVQPIAIVDLATGSKTVTFPADSRNVRALAFSGDGLRLLSGGRDGATDAWDLAKNTLIVHRYAMGNKEWVTVDQKGRFDGTDTGLKSLHWVQDNKPLPLEAFFEQFNVPNLYPSLTGAKVDPASTETPKPPPTPKVDITKPILPPPTVRITTPTSDQTSDQEQATIEVTATDEGGGIDQISLFQNGKLVSNAQRELVELNRSQGKTISKKFAVLLGPGENVFRATAFNKDRTESASPKEVRITLKAPEAGSNLFVLSIGINDYVNDSYDLTFARPDAQAFASEIKTRAAGIFKTISVAQLTDKQATRANIEDAFARISKLAKPGDAFIFFYSGHGLVTEPDDGTQGEFYIVTTDVKKMLGSDDLVKLGISAKGLRDLCMAVPAQKQLIIFDACYSGGALAAFQSRGAAKEKAIHQLSRSTGVAVLAAASPDQTATELKALGHGVFTYAILKGLSGEAAPGTGPRKVTVGELFAYLNDLVPELTKQYRGKAQFPNTFLSGQDFPIVTVKG